VRNRNLAGIRDQRFFDRESAYVGLVNDIRSLLQGFDEVETVNEIRTMHMGPDFILVKISVEFKNLASADDVEQIIARISAATKE